MKLGILATKKFMPMKCRLYINFSSHTGGGSALKKELLVHPKIGHFMILTVFI
jgi:hypothetical protein